MANLDNEVRFFSELAGCAVPGDLCALDFQIAAAPAERPEQILKRDPALTSPLPAAMSRNASLVPSLQL